MGKVMTRLCHDCSAKEGELHQYGCDMERCPFCGGQLISCGCCEEFSEEEFIRGLKSRGKSRIPWVQIPNLCRICGLVWPKMFNVPDEEWEKYIISPLQWEGLCRPCYDRMKKLFPTGWKDVKEDNHATPIS